MGGNPILENSTEIKDFLDVPILFDLSYLGEEEPIKKLWKSTHGRVTFRTAYPKLKEILESAEKATTKPKSALIQGHRKKIFTSDMEKVITHFYTHDKVSKRELARRFHCDEKTIRTIIKKYV